jgi:hypothetical protein
VGATIKAGVLERVWLPIPPEVTYVSAHALQYVACAYFGNDHAAPTDDVKVDASESA